MNSGRYIVEVIFRCWGVFIIAISVSWLLMEVLPLHSLLSIFVSVFISIGTIYVVGIKGRERAFVSAKVVKAISKIQR